MSSFYRLASIVRILVAEIYCELFLSALIINLYEWIRPPASGVLSLPITSTFEYVFILIALLVFLWLLSTIFRPRVHETKSHPIGVAKYSISSTHPSYVFIDLVPAGLWGFFLSLHLSGPQGGSEIRKGAVMLGLALSIPVLRLLAWYGLRLRPRGEEQAVRNAWKPVAIFHGFFLLPIALFLAGALIYEDHQQKQKEANLRVVDPASWKGLETFDSLRDPAHPEDLATRVIRLRAPQKSAGPTLCTNDANHAFGTVLATLGPSEDVLIVSYETGSNNQGGADALVQRARGKEGKPFEMMGRLRPMPDEIPAWKRYCGLEKLSPRPRWVLEAESP